MLRNTPQTLGWEPLDSLHVLACERAPVKRLERVLRANHKWKWVERLEQNQKIATCCRNPVENADIEAWYSGPDDEKKGLPDIYKFYCRCCERVHVKFCVGGNHPLASVENRETHPHYHDLRPKWEIR